MEFSFDSDVICSFRLDFESNLDYRSLVEEFGNLTAPPELLGWNFGEIFLDECGGIIDEPQIITSPGYERGYYYGNLNCTWIIELDNVVSFNIVKVDFELENSFECQFDSVTFNEISVYCGTFFETQNIDGGSARIVFQTDEFDAYKGFKLNITELTMASSTISTTASTIPASTSTFIFKTESIITDSNTIMPSTTSSNCLKAHFATVDCTNYSFVVTLDQNCFDSHWNRGEQWNETLIFGSSGDPLCEFNVADQGSTTFEIKFDECGVVPNYPDSSDKSVIDFNLAGKVKETLIGNDDIESFFDFNYKCEYRGVTEVEEIAELYDADILKVNNTLTLDSSVIPALLSCPISESLFFTSPFDYCEINNGILKLGDLFYVGWTNLFANDLLGAMKFRIENIWIGPSSGEKTLHFVSDGCLKAPFDTGRNIIYPWGRDIEWSAFKFKNSNNVFFTFELIMCIENDTEFCMGATDCGSGIGNQALFVNWLASNDPSNAKRKRKSSADEKGSVFQTQDLVEITGANVEVIVPENAKTREETINGQTIILLSDQLASINSGASGNFSTFLLFFAFSFFFF
ncbi:Oidioi.mRNA.OKI2018_I69.chr2.g4157.t1.cds [Oikopleura dioica]|uniref:Oidioi.mRNA.OKI2018_I69.chr2.g4157.t1.cds n=1 Tax=Oikopleura dioica TaxID=34765 RepID=A0ABN7T0A0_OIKDI|nr:Oidioi.mRNA.OKI2018_I69.chr2.g4157.t1.cds [Oikopleura dioica]